MPIKHSWQRTIALVAAAAVLATSVGIAPACLAAGVYQQNNLVSDLPGMAAHTDSHLVNPWGIASSANSPFWVADSSGTPQSLVVTVPPALAGMAGSLANPFLELHDINGTLIESNDDWMNSPEKAAIIASGLAPTDPHESAILKTLTAGTNYTAVLRGVNNTTGIGLVEVYDLEPTNDTHLANISGRGFVSTGDDVLIGGVIVRGGSPEEILLRAIGPSLTAKGVKNALQDPTLDLYDVNGTLIAHNDDWMNSPNKNAIIATGLAPTDPRESAVLETPAPGNYTAIVRGKNNTAGVALVEAYRLGPPPPASQ